MKILASLAIASVLAVAQPSDPTMHTVTALTDGRAFARIPAGEFTMGSSTGNPDEIAPHRVRITRAFEIGRYEVTQAQWEAVMRDPHAATNASKPSEDSSTVDPAAKGDTSTKKDDTALNPAHFKGPTRPIENVSWDDVQVFIERLNKRDPQHAYRLPTEAEWEYAALANHRFDPAQVAGAAWYQVNAEKETHPIGAKAPNPWGLHDMLGNVFEWVQDWYAPEYTALAVPDPTGPATGSYKVYRGCAWLSAEKQCRPAFRGFDFPNQGYYSVGFRLVRTKR